MTQAPSNAEDKVEQTDNYLLQLIRQGDCMSFTTLFKKYYKVLVLFAHSFVKDKDVAEDLVQSFFCKLWEDRLTMAKITNCKNYFYIAIRNRCHNYIRNNKLIPVPFPDNLTEDNLLNTIIEEEISVKLIEKIQLLPKKCRNIMLMKIQGMDNKTIAATLHIREETVRSQIHRGKEILKNHFQMAYPALWIVPSFLESIFFF